MPKWAITLWLLLLIPSIGRTAEEQAIEIWQPILVEDGICLTRVTFVTFNSGVSSWAGRVDYTCEANALITDSEKQENRNAASIAGIKAWVDPYHFQEQTLYGDTARVYVDLTKLDTSHIHYDVVSATLECVLANAVASMTGFDETKGGQVAAKHLRVVVRGTPDQQRLSRTYRLSDLKGKLPRRTLFDGSDDE